MTENKYSWLGAVLVEVQNSGVEFANNVRSSASLALAQAQEAIIAKIEAEKAEARIDEWKEFQWAHDVSDTIKDIVYVNYIKDRVSGLKMELGELTKELKEEA